jgi:hypothetical protein
MSGSGGGIRQRRDGKWEGRYYQDGRRLSVYGVTHREVQRKLRDGIAAVDRGERRPAQRTTVGAWLETWMTTNVGPRSPGGSGAQRPHV